MSNYCKQCSEHLFGEDTRDLAGDPGYWLCEGCGEMVPVDKDGKRTDGKWLQPHTVAWADRINAPRARQEEK